VLATAQPILHDGEFGFCSILTGMPVPTGLTPLLQFAEEEGTTLVVPLNAARARGIACELSSRIITLNVNSAFDAVGFLAMITGRLAHAGISVNAISVYHHDHIFVPSSRAEVAIRLLSNLD
jgi:hypothetical protein